MGSPSAPKAPTAPPAPTETRRQAQFALDQQNRDQSNQGPRNPLQILRDSLQDKQLSRFGIENDPQARLDSRPDSDFLPPVDDRDFQSLDAQIRGRSGEEQGNTVRNREMQRSLLELLGEDVNSPTIL